MSGGVLAWLSVWARCRFAYGPADTTATHCFLLQEIQIGFGFTFLAPAHPGSPRQNPDSHKMVVVVVLLPVQFSSIQLLFVCGATVTTTPIWWPLFQNNLCTQAPEKQNHCGFWWSRRQWGGSDISWTTCNSFALHFRHITTPVPHHSSFMGQMFFLMPNQQCQSTEGTATILWPPRLCLQLPGWAGTRKVKPIWIYWSKTQWVALASDGPYANLHLAQDR